MKPKLVDVLEIVAMKQQASELYDEIDKRINAMFVESGSGRFDYDLSTSNNFDTEGHVIGTLNELKESGGYLKFEITDNVEALTNGATVFKSVSMKPISFSSRSLKRCPKSLE